MDGTVDPPSPDDPPLGDLPARLAAVRGAIRQLRSSTPASPTSLRALAAADSVVLFNYLRYDEDVYDAMRQVATSASDPGVLTFYARAMRCRVALSDALVARLGADTCRWFSTLAPAMFGDEPERRRAAIAMFRAMQEAARGADVSADPGWLEIRESIKNRHVDTIQRLLKDEPQDSDWSGLWCVLVVMMGREILTNRECLVLFNNLLNILGDVFRHQQALQTSTVADGFRCWQTLIDLFFQHREHLRDKHYKLLMNLMKNRPKVDKPVLVGVKARTWWRFLHHLDPKADRFRATTANFLEFCCSSVVTEDARFCLEAIALIMGEHLSVGSTYDYELPKPEFGQCLPGREHFLKLHPHVFAIFERLLATSPFDLVAPGSPGVALVSRAWARVLARVDEIVRMQTANSHAADVVRAMLIALGRVATCEEPGLDERSRRQGLLIAIPPLLAGEGSLPVDVLTSTKHYAGEGLMVGTPALYLTRLLLGRHLTRTRLREDEYLAAVRALVRAAVGAPLAGVEYVQRMVATLTERASEPGDEAHLDVITAAWRVLAECLVEAVGRLVVSSPDLDWLYSAIEFPAVFGGTGAPDALRALLDRTVKATMSLSLGPDEVCERLCARLSALLERRPDRLPGVAGCLKAVVCACTPVADREGRLPYTLELMGSVSGLLRADDPRAGDVATNLCSAVWALVRGWPDTDSLLLRMVPVIQTLYEHRGNREAPFDKLFLMLLRQLWKTYLVKRHNQPGCPPEVRQAVGDLVVMVKELMAKGEMGGGGGGPEVVEVVDDFENSPTPVPLAMYYLMPVPGRRILAARNNSQSVGRGRSLPPPKPPAPAAPDDDEVVCLSGPTVASRPLTKHQRESMRRRRDDIPALYGDLTQETQAESQPDDGGSTQEMAPERFAGQTLVEPSEDSSAAREPFVQCATQQVDLSRPFGDIFREESTPERAAKPISIFNAARREKMSPVQLKWVHAKRKGSPERSARSCRAKRERSVSPNDTPKPVADVASKVLPLANGTIPCDIPMLETNEGTPSKISVLATGVTDKTPLLANVVTPSKTSVLTDVTPSKTTLLMKVLTPTNSPKCLTNGTPSKTSVLENVLTPSNSPILATDTTPSKSSLHGHVLTPSKTPGLLGNISTPSKTSVLLPANVLTPNSSPVLASDVLSTTCPITSTEHLARFSPKVGYCKKVSDKDVKKPTDEPPEGPRRRKSILAPLVTTTKEKAKNRPNAAVSETEQAARVDGIFSGDSVFVAKKPATPPPTTEGEARPLVVSPPSKDETSPADRPEVSEIATVTDSQDFVDSSQESVRSVKITLEKLPDIPPGGNAIIAHEGLVSRGPEAGSPIRLHRAAEPPPTTSTVRKALQLDAAECVPSTVHTYLKRSLSNADAIAAPRALPVMAVAIAEGEELLPGARVYEITPAKTPVVSDEVPEVASAERSEIASAETPKPLLKKRMLADSDIAMPVKVPRTSMDPPTRVSGEVRRVALLAPTSRDNNVVDVVEVDAPPIAHDADKTTHTARQLRELKNLKIDFAPSALQIPRKRRRKTDTVDGAAELSDTESVDSLESQGRVLTRRGKGKPEQEPGPGDNKVKRSLIATPGDVKCETLKARTARLTGDTCKRPTGTLVPSEKTQSQKVKTEFHHGVNCLRRRSSKLLPGDEPPTKTVPQKNGTIWEKFRLANRCGSPSKPETLPAKTCSEELVSDVKILSEGCVSQPPEAVHVEQTARGLESPSNKNPDPAAEAEDVPPEIPREIRSESCKIGTSSTDKEPPPTPQKVPKDPRPTSPERVVEICVDVTTKDVAASDITEANAPGKSSDLHSSSYNRPPEKIDAVTAVSVTPSPLPVEPQGLVECEETVQTTEVIEETPIVPDSQPEIPSDPGTPTTRLIPRSHPRTLIGGRHRTLHRRHGSRSQEIIRIGNEKIETERNLAEEAISDPPVPSPGMTIDYENCVETTTDSNGVNVSRPWVKGVWSPGLLPCRPILKGASPQEARRRSLKRVNFPDEFVVTKELVFVRAKRASQGDPVEASSRLKGCSPLREETKTVAMSCEAVTITLAQEPKREGEEPPAGGSQETQETQEFVSPIPLALPMPELMDDAAFFFPQLVDCDKPVNDVTQFMVTPTWRNSLALNLKDDLIETVGDFCRLTERQISRLPLREPKVDTARKTLRKYARCLAEAEQAAREREGVPPTDVELALADRTPREVADALQNLPNCNDHLNYIFERMSRTQKLQGIDHTYLIRHILRLCDASEIFDALAAEHRKRSTGSFVDSVTQYVARSNDDIRELVACGIQAIRTEDLVRILDETPEVMSDPRVVSCILAGQDCGKVLAELKQSGRFGPEAIKFTVENVDADELLAMMGDTGRLGDVDASRLCGRLAANEVLSYVVGSCQSADICDRLPLGEVLAFAGKRASPNDLARLLSDNVPISTILDHLEATGRFGAIAKYTVEKGTADDLLCRLKDAGRLGECTRFVVEKESTEVLLGHVREADGLAACTKFVCDNEPAVSVMKQLKDSGKLRESAAFVVATVKSSDVLDSVADNLSEDAAENADGIGKVLTSFCEKFGIEKYLEMCQGHLKKTVLGRTHAGSDT